MKKQPLIGIEDLVEEKLLELYDEVEDEEMEKIIEGYSSQRSTMKWFVADLVMNTLGLEDLHREFGEWDTDDNGYYKMMKGFRNAIYNQKENIKLYLKDEPLLLKQHKKQIPQQNVRSLEWRQKVLERDGYTCQECGAAFDVELHAHHIKPVKDYPELAKDIDNGKTLCRECHKKTDSWGRGPS